MPSAKTLRHQRKVAVRNRPVRTRARSAVANARSAVTKQTDGASVALNAAVSALDRAAQKGIIHANNAARRKSRLMRHRNQVSADKK